MSARDIYHNNCKNALIKDGWKITHDPLRLVWGKKDLYVDLGAQRLIAAQKAEEKIEVDDLEKALGQYILYHDILARREPDRTLYLAVRDVIFIEVFNEPIGQLLLDNSRIKLLVFQPSTEVVTRWIN